VNLRPRYPMQFLIAIVAASLLWYALAVERNENTSVRGVRAFLTVVNVPIDLVITSSVPDTVLLQLRGLLSNLDPTKPPEVFLDLSDARPGLSSYLINASDIPLPAEVEVVSVEPQAINLELERQETRLVPVRPVVTGVPAPGFVVGDVRSAPAQFTIQGPQSLLLAFEYLETNPISIEAASGPVEAMVEPLLPDPQLRAIGVGPIQVVVEIVPEEVPEEEDVGSN